MTFKIRKKIAVVVPKYGLVGGGEKFTSELTERIAQNRCYDIHVFANKWVSHSDLIAFHKIPIIRFPKFLTTISFAFFANRKIAKMNFDLIHTHDRIFKADIFTMHGIPHQIWVKEVRKKNMSLYDYTTRWVERRLVRSKKYRRFLSVSNLTKEKFLQEYNVDPNDVQIIHPGVDIYKFKSLDKKACRHEIRSRFCIDESDIMILFVGMNFEIKGLDNLMSAIAIIRSKYPFQKPKLLVVGKGNYRKYRKLAQNLGLKDNVIFAGVWKNNIEKIYLASDIFCMLSKFDTFGMTILEAMAASLPVIISNHVGAKDLVRQGVNGFVIENIDNVDNISSKIIFMLNEKNRKKMAEESFNTAQNNTWEFVAERVEKLYQTIIPITHRGQ